MAKRPIIIATRGSDLALAQARAIQAQCRREFPNLEFELKEMKTTGDKVKAILHAGLGKGLFTKELELALLNGEAQIAVHSLKDLPTELPEGLMLGAVSEREDARDVLITRSRMRLKDLRQGAIVGTSSTRREAFLRDRRPDLNVVPIRGNVPTRIKRLAEHPEMDGIVLAAAGLIRLGYDFQKINAVPLDFDEMLPCVGQAAIGVEIRSDDSEMKRVCEKLNDPITFACVTAERAFLKGMGGGCQVPVAAYAEAHANELHVRAASFFVKPPRRGEITGPISQAESLGRQLAARLS